MPYVRPALAGVVVAGNPIIEELRWHTVDATHSVPGRFVIRDTTDGEIQLAGSGGTAAIGIVLVPNDTTKSLTAAAVLGDWARVAHGPGVVVSAYYDKGNGNSVVKGEDLNIAANGKVYKAAATTASAVIGKAEESRAADGIILIRLAR